MSAAALRAEAERFVVRLGPLSRRIGDREFHDLCRLNPELRIERSAEGELIILPPTGGDTGRRNFSLTGFFFAWVRRDGTGVGFDSSTGFVLPNGAKRSPDLAWVRKSRWLKLSGEEREEFPPLCPDFVVELRSPRDGLGALQAKMDEYIANGASLGWLIDPVERRVHVYRPPRRPLRLKGPRSISGEPLLRGFVLDLDEVW